MGKWPGYLSFLANGEENIAVVVLIKRAKKRGSRFLLVLVFKITEIK